MAAILFVFALLLLTIRSNLAELSDTVIYNRFFGIFETSGGTGNACNNPISRQRLYIVQQRYGYECVKEDENNYELRFSTCFIDRTENSYSVVSDGELVDMIALQEHSSLDDGSEVWKICKRVVQNPRAYTVLKPINGTSWDILVSDYPHGVYDLNFEESQSQPGTIELDIFDPPNVVMLRRRTSLKDVNDGMVQKNCSESEVDEIRYYMVGVAVYECTSDALFQFPKFLGCVLDSPQKHDNTYQYDKNFHMLVEGDIDRLRRMYSFASFLTKTRVLRDDIGNLTSNQICARIATMTDFKSLFEQPAKSISSTVFPYYEDATGDVFYAPAFRLD